MGERAERDDPMERLPAGDLSVTFEVAGVRVRLDGLPVAERPFLPAHYPGFYSLAPGPAELAVACRLREGGSILPLPPPGGEPSMEVKASGADLVSTRSHWHEAAFDCGAGRGELLLTDLRRAPFRMSVENFLRVAFANLLVRRGGCLVHAAGIVQEGRAYVFFGPSGAGKSTVTELSRPRPALSDDMIAMRLEAGELRAERVPFYGVYPPTERHGGRYPVARLLRLVQDARHALEDLPRAVQVLELRAALPFLDPSDPRPLDVCGRAAAAVPVRKLRFARDAGFWDLLAGPGRRDENG
jgi:hypothetical protein